MLKFKKYLSIIGIWVIVLIVYLLLLSALNYTGIVRYKNIVSINFVVIAIMTFILGIVNGKKSLKKGYIEGLKLGGLIIGILLILNLIFFRQFSLSIFTYYLLILASATIGSVIGINIGKK